MVQFGYRFLVHSFLQVGSAEPEACLDEFGVELYRLLVLLDCSVVLSAKVQDVSDPGVGAPNDVCASASLLSISSAFSAAVLAFGKASFGGRNSSSASTA